MGIIDRDYMKRDTDKKAKESTYNPREFIGNESDFVPPRWNREKTQNEKTRINLGIIKEHDKDGEKYKQESRHHINDVVDAEWWDGKQWKGGIEQNNVIDEKPWVRPWLWQIFILMLVIFAIQKTIEYSKELRARNIQEKLSIHLNEQQEAERQAQAYRSPYANMPRMAPYRSPYDIPPEPARTQPAPLLHATERPPSIIVSEGVTILEGSKDGHYFSSGTVNGFPVVFMVDTGATTISISEDTAARAGIRECNQARFNTANGNIVGCKAIVPMIEFGRYKIGNVEVAIMKNLTSHSLLGMNVLQLFKMQQHENRLFISPNT